MDWDDAEEIGEALYEAYPDIDPLSLRFTNLQQMVIDLPEFVGENADANESRLEAIQMAWLDECERHGS